MTNKLEGSQQQAVTLRTRVSALYAGIAMLGACIAPMSGLCDAIYFPQRVINQAKLLPQGEAPSIPASATARYNNNLGNWSACDIYNKEVQGLLVPLVQLADCAAYDPLQPVLHIVSVRFPTPAGTFDVSGNPLPMTPPCLPPSSKVPDLTL